MQKYLAEFVGTTLFLYVILATGNAIAIGAVLALIIMVTGPISGGFINPAVVFAKVSNGELPTKEALPYCVAEILGALLAVQLYKYVKL